MVTILGRNFEGSFPLYAWEEPRAAGVYLVTTPNGTVLYVGETGNFEKRHFESHHARNRWDARGGSSIHITRMPGSTQDERRLVEKIFIQHFNPPCNREA